MQQSPRHVPKSPALPSQMSCTHARAPCSVHKLNAGQQSLAARTKQRGCHFKSFHSNDTTQFAESNKAQARTGARSGNNLGNHYTHQCTMQSEHSSDDTRNSVAGTAMGALQPQPSKPRIAATHQIVSAMLWSMYSVTAQCRFARQHMPLDTVPGGCHRLLGSKAAHERQVIAPHGSEICQYQHNRRWKAMPLQMPCGRHGMGWQGLCRDKQSAENTSPEASKTPLC